MRRIFPFPLIALLAIFTVLTSQQNQLRANALPSSPEELFNDPGNVTADRPAGSGKVVANFSGQLSKSDPFDTIRKKHHAKMHMVQLQAGVKYQIDLMSGDGKKGPHNPGWFDVWLRLENASGKELGSNDDGGEGFNARLHFTAPQSASYRLIVTSYTAGATGNYTLTVAQSGTTPTQGGTQTGAGGTQTGTGGKPQQGFHTFDDHVKHVQQAQFEHYKGKPGVKVASAAEFNKMKSHLQSLYQGVKVTHTFTGHDGHHVDCVALDKQPGALAALKQGHKLQLVPPNLRGMPKASGKKLHSLNASNPHQLKKGMKDKFGKEMYCPQGSIPMRRITLEDMTRFASHHDFFKKHHGGSQHQVGAKTNTPKKPRTLDDLLFPSRQFPEVHRYAHAFQDVPNYGGSSWLNLWKPTPTANQFSLSQQWYTGGNPVQTVEGGWQVYPSLYGHSDPVLFVFWTADGYNNTGAYNLTKPGFVQVSSTHVVGSPWSAYSTPGSTQWGFRMIWYRDPANGNWWLFLETGAGSVAVGYYPQSLYGNGQMSQYATRIDYGGEVTGQTATGQMGSGSFANAGFQQSAFQCQIYCFPTTGNSAWANLAAEATNPNYYTIDVHNFAAEPNTWGTYFYYGGPGGT